MLGKLRLIPLFNGKYFCLSRGLTLTEVVIKIIHESSIPVE